MAQLDRAEILADKVVETRGSNLFRRLCGLSPALIVVAEADPVADSIESGQVQCRTLWLTPLSSGRYSRYGVTARMQQQRRR